MFHFAGHRRRFHGWQLRTKLIIAFLLNFLLIGAAAGTGLLFIFRIEGNVHTVTEVASPLVTEVAELASGLDEMKLIAVGALSRVREADLASDEGRLDAADRAVRQHLDRLTRVSADDPTIGLDVPTLARLHTTYAQLSRQILSVQLDRLVAAAVAGQRLRSFEEQSQPLAAAMADLTSQGEARMAANEDRSRTLVQSGVATVDGLQQVIAEIYAESYPVVQGSNKVLQFLAQLQDLGRSYTTESDPARLTETERRFTQLARAARSRLGRLERLNGAVAEQNQRFAALEGLVLAEDGLFAARRQSLQADVRAQTLRTEFQGAQEAYQRQLETIQAAAGQLNQAARDTAQRSVAEATATLSVAMLLGLAVVAGAGWLFGRVLIRPLARMTGTMRRLAEGDTTVVIPDADRGDEIGSMAKAVQVFKTNAMEVERLQTEQEAQKRRAEEERRAGMLKLADEFEKQVGGVVDTMSSAATEMQSMAQSMASIADQSSHRATAVAAASEQASGNVQTVAAAAAELASSIGEIGRQVGEASTISRRGVEDAHRTSLTMQDLNKAAEKIGDVVRLIEGIAGQVNLLALNATIEAARAGAAGKGFAVVANEVKNLASQAGSATQDITRQVSGVQSETRKAVESIAGITSTIKRIDKISTVIASAVEEQTAATQEISRNVQQAAQGTGAVSRNITGVTQAASEAGAASTQVFEAARKLSLESETLRSVVNGFIAKVRAGT